MISNSKNEYSSVSLDVLKKYMLVDGFDIILDLDRCEGFNIYDKKTGKHYLDFFTFVASNAIGLNHPDLNNDDFINYIGKIAVNKPSLSDIYAEEQIRFVDTFFKYAVPDYLKHIFLIDGGALAVENALKVAFDWKVRKNFEKGHTSEKGQQILHFKQAFHGRSGYTMSLTNTDPNKTMYFPKFNWPRVSNPKVTFPIQDNLEEIVRLEDITKKEIKSAILNNKDDIAAIILEPIQGEGGDNYFRKEFFTFLRNICDEEDILLILDEVQTGIGITGKWWAHEHYVQPDLISFGKKTQVCGTLASERVDEIKDNVFAKSSRINSTWGGNMVDMCRFRRILEVIHKDNLVSNAEVQGAYLKGELYKLQENYPDIVSNTRGLGLFCAFDCPSPEYRNKLMNKCYENGLIILGCGDRSIRFRPALNITKAAIDACINIITDSIKIINK